MAISMLKIRRPLGRLIFNMGIAIAGKTVFLIETAPRSLPTNSCLSYSISHCLSSYMYDAYVFLCYLIKCSFVYNVTVADASIAMWKLEFQIEVGRWRDISWPISFDQWFQRGGPRDNSLVPRATNSNLNWWRASGVPHIHNIMHQ